VTVAVGDSPEVGTAVGCSVTGAAAIIGLAAVATGLAAAGIATTGGTAPAVAGGVSALASCSLKVRSFCPRTTSFPEMALTVKPPMRSPTPTMYDSPPISTIANLTLPPAIPVTLIPAVGEDAPGNCAGAEVGDSSMAPMKTIEIPANQRSGLVCNASFEPRGVTDHHHLAREVGSPSRVGRLPPTRPSPRPLQAPAGLGVEASIGRR
jgi:hypothetical protein